MFFNIIYIFLCILLVQCEEPILLFYGMEPCSNSTTKDAIEVSHDWSQGLFSGSLKLPESLDTSIHFKAVIYKLKGNNSWQQLGEMEDILCTVLNGLLQGVWSKIAQTVGIPPDCPIPEGSYTIKDFSISAEDAKIPLIKGKFKIVTEVLKNNESLICREILIQSSDYHQTV